MTPSATTSPAIHPSISKRSRGTISNNEEDEEDDQEPAQRRVKRENDAPSQNKTMYEAEIERQKKKKTDLETEVQGYKSKLEEAKADIKKCDLLITVFQESIDEGR